MDPARAEVIRPDSQAYIAQSFAGFVISMNYAKGDATLPTKRPAMIVHVCNDVGGWGAGFVLAISRRWPEPEQRFRQWAKGSAEVPYELGQVQFVQVEPDLWVANLVGQHGLRRTGGMPPVRYDAIREGLAKVAMKARDLDLSVHMPRIGCGLAGGTWEEIGPIVEEELAQKGVDVTVYDFA